MHPDPVALSMDSWKVTAQEGPQGCPVQPSSQLGDRAGKCINGHPASGGQVGVSPLLCDAANYNRRKQEGMT